VFRFKYMEKKNEDTIKTTVADVLRKMGVEGEVSVIKAKDGSNDVICNIKIADEASLIIGKEGENLRALQHLSRLLVRKQSDDFVRFIVDINFYKQEKNDSVIDLANDMAERAIKEKRPVVLRPMTAYERRLVHMTLEENENVKTESIDDGEERKVVIKAISHI